MKDTEYIYFNFNIIRSGNAAFFVLKYTLDWLTYFDLYFPNVKKNGTQAIETQGYLWLLAIKY